jgi:hypothetical protein
VHGRPGAGLRAENRPPRSVFRAPRILPSGPREPVEPLSVAPSPVGYALVRTIAQSQSRRLKMTYRLVHTAAISPIANGYPNTQCNSGMWSKFMP